MNPWLKALIGTLVGSVILALAVVFGPYYFYQQWATGLAGDVTIGMDSETVRERFGEPDEISTLTINDDESVFWTYTYPGVTTWPGVKAVELTIWDGETQRTSYREYFSNHVSQIVNEYGY